MGADGEGEGADHVDEGLTAEVEGEAVGEEDDHQHEAEVEV